MECISCSLKKEFYETHLHDCYVTSWRYLCMNSKRKQKNKPKFWPISNLKLPRHWICIHENLLLCLKRNVLWFAKFRKAWVALKTKSRQVCFDNQKNCQIPVISWLRQVRPTCPWADKNSSTETNLQRNCCPTLKQDFLWKTNIKCFLVIKLSINFENP